MSLPRGVKPGVITPICRGKRTAEERVGWEGGRGTGENRLPLRLDISILEKQTCYSINLIIHGTARGGQVPPPKRMKTFANLPSGNHKLTRWKKSQNPKDCLCEYPLRTHSFFSFFSPRHEESNAI